MNLFYTLTAYLPYIGGAQLHQHLLARQFQATHAIQVATFWDANRTDWLLGTTLKAHSQPYEYEVDGIAVHRLGLSWIDKLRLAPWVPLYYPLMGAALPAIAQVICDRLSPLMPDSDLIHNVRIGREGLTYASLQLARQRDIPFVLTPVHHPRWQGWRYREYDKLYQQADAVIALTDSERKTLIQIGVKPERIHVTGIGPILAATANPEKFRTDYSISSPFILFLGQHYSYKGFRQLLEATPLVWHSFPDVHFVFIGPTVQQSDKIFTAFTDHRIHRLGAVDLQTKTDALAACEVLCVPSTQESFGGVYVEAWSFRKPVVGGRIPAIADVITERQDGLLVNQSPAEIADALKSLLTHPEVAHRMGEAGYQKVQTQFTWPQIARKVLQVYESVL